MISRSNIRSRLRRYPVSSAAIALGWLLIVCPILIRAAGGPALSQFHLPLIGALIASGAMILVELRRRAFRRRVLCPRCMCQLHEAFPKDKDAEFLCPECGLRFGLREYCSEFNIVIGQDGRPITTRVVLPRGRPPAAVLMLYAIGLPMFILAIVAFVRLANTSSSSSTWPVWLIFPGVACVVIATALWQYTTAARLNEHRD